MYYWISYKCSISYFHTPITIFERRINIFISPRLRTLIAISCFIFCFAFFFSALYELQDLVTEGRNYIQKEVRNISNGTNDNTSIANNKKDFIMCKEINKKRWININNKKKSFYFFTTFLFFCSLYFSILFHFFRCSS